MTLISSSNSGPRRSHWYLKNMHQYVLGGFLKVCPWLTKDFKKLSATRDKLKKQGVRSKSNIVMDVYRQTRNNVNKLNTDLKREGFTNKIASRNGDLKNTWKTINTFLNKKSKTTQIAALQLDGRQICDNESVAESMNEFFCSIGNTLSDKIPRHLIHFWKWVLGKPTKSTLRIRDYQYVSVREGFRCFVHDCF